MRKTISAALAATLLTGCAAGYRAAYTTGAVTKEFVTNAHEDYDRQARAKLELCDPQKNPTSTVKTKSDLDECMTPPFAEAAQDKVVKALAVYKAAAEAATAVLIGVEPGAKLTSEQRREIADAVGSAFEAALDVLALFPKGDELTNELKGLVVWWCFGCPGRVEGRRAHQ